MAAGWLPSRSGQCPAQTPARHPGPQYQGTAAQRERKRREREKAVAASGLATVRWNVSEDHITIHDIHPQTHYRHFIWHASCGQLLQHLHSVLALSWPCQFMQISQHCNTGGNPTSMHVRTYTLRREHSHVSCPGEVMPRTWAPPSSSGTCAW